MRSHGVNESHLDDEIYLFIYSFIYLFIYSFIYLLSYDAVEEVRRALKKLELISTNLTLLS